MIDAYLTIAAVFSGWALGYLDFDEFQSKMDKSQWRRFFEFLIAFAAGMFWPILIIAASLTGLMKKIKRQLAGG